MVKLSHPVTLIILSSVLMLAHFTCILQCCCENNYHRNTCEQKQLKIHCYLWVSSIHLEMEHPQKWGYFTKSAQLLNLGNKAMTQKYNTIIAQP